MRENHWKAIIGGKNGKAVCPYCETRKVLLKSKRQAARHFNDEHRTAGYSFKILEWTTCVGTRWGGRTKILIEISGPCACGCGETVRFPSPKGWMPNGLPPYFKSGHNSKGTHGGPTAFKPGHVPLNKGIPRPGWTNEGSFKKGHLPANYKGGIAIGWGVVSRLVPGKKYPCGATVRVNVGRETAEKMIGRPLRHEEVVFHKDGDYRNNEPGNIEVLTRGESINKARARLLEGKARIGIEKREERKAASEARRIEREKRQREKLELKAAKRLERAKMKTEKHETRLPTIVPDQDVDEPPIRFEQVRKSAREGLGLDHLRKEEPQKKPRPPKYKAPQPNAPRELWGKFCPKCKGLFMPGQPHRCK